MSDKGAVSGSMPWYANTARCLSVMSLRSTIAGRVTVVSGDNGGAGIRGGDIGAEPPPRTCEKFSRFPVIVSAQAVIPRTVNRHARRFLMPQPHLPNIDLAESFCGRVALQSVGMTPVWRNMVEHKECPLPMLTIVDFGDTPHACTPPRQTPTNTDHHQLGKEHHTPSALPGIRRNRPPTPYS